jgi:hypothetical protein
VSASVSTVKPCASKIASVPPNHSMAVLKDGDRIIECRLGPEWNDQAKKLNKDDWVNMQGRISNKPARLGSEFKGDHEVLVTRGHLRLETALKNLKRTVEHIVSRMSSLETKRPK